MNITFTRQGNPDSGIREMFASAIRNSGILSGGIWNPGFWNPKLQLKETGIVLTIGIRNPSSIDKETDIQNSRLS